MSPEMLTAIRNYATLHGCAILKVPPNYTVGTVGLYANYAVLANHSIVPMLIDIGLEEDLLAMMAFILKQARDNWSALQWSRLYAENIKRGQYLIKRDGPV